MILALTTSCTKPPVQQEPAETVGLPSAVQPVEEPADATVTRPPPPLAKPLEETISESEAERRRKEEEAVFVNEDIHFDYDQYVLRQDAREILADKARFLSKYPGTGILIEGHCDERGTNEYNLALGERRASSAKQYLVQLGVSAKRINTISYGEERPLEVGDDEEAWAKNRRAHFEIIAR
jgi:peptidoglycan-associated lipoprotein